MKLAFFLMLLIAIFGSISISCPPPLNDFRYADDRTLFGEALDEMESNSNLSTLQTGGYNAAAPESPITVWPYNRDLKTRIPYCYWSYATRQAVMGVFGKANNL
jgi:hypothetical protein